MSAILKGGSAQLIELTNQTGDTIVPVTYTFTPANSSHVIKAAYLGSDSAVVVPITGVMRAGVHNTTLVGLYLRNTVSSGSPSAKALRLLFFSASGYPATTPTSATAITLINTDAPYLIGHYDIASADWKTVTSTVSAAAYQNINIRLWNDDTPTLGTTIYMVAVNNDSTYTPPSGEKIEVAMHFKMN